LRCRALTNKGYRCTRPALYDGEICGQHAFSKYTSGDLLLVRDCVGCGYCCRTAPCSTALSYGAPSKSPCLFLTEDYGVNRCLLLLGAGEGRRQQLEEDLSIGEGCCSPLNSDRRDFLHGVKNKET